MPGHCAICGREGSLANDENCPTCDARGRTRSLALLMEEVVGQLPALPLSKPLLAFAMTSGERQQLARIFQTFTSASLYGEYGAEHEAGVDIRNLIRYGQDSKAGIFGSLIFDYFPQHEHALSQAFTVIAEGGIFFTHIAPYRLRDGNEQPRVVGTVKPRPDAMSYVPREGIPSVEVGRCWFLHALSHAGFSATNVTFEDGATRNLDWFIGIKRVGVGADAS